MTGQGKAVNGRGNAVNGQGKWEDKERQRKVEERRRQAEERQRKVEERRRQVEERQWQAEEVRRDSHCLGHTWVLVVRKEVGPLVAAGFVTPARRCSVRVVGQFAVGDAIRAGPRAVAVAVIRSLQAGAGLSRPVV